MSRESNNTFNCEHIDILVSAGPTGFKIGVSPDRTPKVTENDDLAACSRSLTYLGNNVCMQRFFKRISQRYDRLYSQRAFVHWFVAEGMEEGELCEAREDLGFIEKDYWDVYGWLLTPTDEEDDEEEDD